MRSQTIRLLACASFALQAQAFYDPYPEEIGGRVGAVAENSKSSNEVKYAAPASLSKRLMLGVADASAHVTTWFSGWGQPNHNQVSSRDDHRTLQYIPSTELSKLVTRDTNTSAFINSTTPCGTSSTTVNQDGHNITYFTTLYFGSQKTPMNMLIDTGGLETWVMASNCTSSYCSSHNTFDPNASTTLNITGEKLSLNYGSGRATGYYASDTVSTGDLSTTFTFGLVDSVSLSSTFVFDGLLGMSNSNSTPSNESFWGAISPLLDDPTFHGFGINLPTLDDRDGEMNFGFADTSKDITYVETNKRDNGWNITMDDSLYNGESAGTGSVPAYIDTGTTFMFVPQTSCDALHKLVTDSTRTAEGAWYVPCNTTGSIQFKFNGAAFNMSSSSWVDGSSNGDLCPSHIACSSAFSDGTWLIGDMFLSNVYTVFDFGASRVGFAPRGETNTTCSPTTTSSGTGKPTSTATSTSASASATKHSGAEAISARNSGLSALVALVVLAVVA